MQKDILLISPNARSVIRIRNMLNSMRDKYLLLDTAAHGTAGVEKALLLNADIIILYQWAGMIECDDILDILSERGCMSRVLVISDDKTDYSSERNGVVFTPENTISTAQDLLRILRQLEQTEMNETERISHNLYQSIMKCASMTDMAIVKDRYKLDLRLGGYWLAAFCRLLTNDIDADRYVAENGTSLQRILKEYDGGTVFCIENTICILANDTNRAEEMFVRIQMYLTRNGKRVYFYVAERVKGLRSAQCQLEESENKMHLCFLSGNTPILYEQSIRVQENSPDTVKEIDRQIREIQYDLAEMDSISVTEDIRELLLFNVKPKMDYQLYDYSIRKLSAIYKHEAVTYAVTGTEADHRQLHSAYYIEEATDIICDRFSSLMSCTFRSVAETPVIRNAVNYIRKNYRTVTVADVCSEFGLSSSYFSRLFKETTGTNYIDFLKSVRMRHAKDYLTDGKYKVYEVADLTGFVNVKHFGVQFREFTGMTPREYVRNAASAGNDFFTETTV